MFTCVLAHNPNPDTTNRFPRLQNLLLSNYHTMPSDTACLSYSTCQSSTNCWICQV